MDHGCWFDLCIEAGNIGFLFITHKINLHLHQEEANKTRGLLWNLFSEKLHSLSSVVSTGDCHHPILPASAFNGARSSLLVRLESAHCEHDDKNAWFMGNVLLFTGNKIFSWNSHSSSAGTRRRWIQHQIFYSSK